jgi:uncharacterized protein YbjT (DUF2867 family)
MTIRMSTRVFLTGATGYIGGRLAPRLLDAGYEIVCLTREVEKLRARPWAGRPGVSLVEGDVARRELLEKHMRGCGYAYYLVHSMVSAGKAYADVDRALALTFARAADKAAVSRIIYLGGLGETGAGLSEHLTSRREVETALQSTSVPVTVLRAAMIIGAGSASFEILRYLVERLPIMVTPKWVHTECQPISVNDVLHVLVRVLELPETTGHTFDVGGADTMTYREILQTVAEVLGLRRRLIVPVPVLTPRLSSLWIHLVTPVSHRIARPLAEGLRNRVVCRDDSIARLTGHRFLTVRESIEAAVSSLTENRVPTAWSDAGVVPGDPDWAGGTSFSDERSITIRAQPEVVFRTILLIGGDHGYFAADWLWWLRGLLDRLTGGPGLRRGRRHPKELAYGDAVDFWRVSEIEPNRTLTLRAEMKLPGEAVLHFGVQPHPEGSRLEQRALFKPRGLAGIVYWYAVAPLHRIVFRGMLRGIRSAAEAPATTSSVG